MAEMIIQKLIFSDSGEADLSTATTSEEYDTNAEDYFGDSGSWEDEDPGEFHDPVNNTSGIGFTISAECGNFSMR